MDIKSPRRKRRVVPMENVPCEFCKRLFERPINRPYKRHCTNDCVLLAFYGRELVAAGKTVT